MQIESDRQDRGRNGPMLVALHVGQFAFAGIVAAVIVGLATAVASRRVGEREGISEARVTTLIKAEGVVEPVLTDSLLGDAGGPTVARLQAVVKREVIDNSLVRTELWSKGGTILYSDEPRLIGRQFNLGPDELNALGTGRIFADVSDLQEPRNVYEREIGSKLLSVYLPVHTPKASSPRSRPTSGTTR
jgi:two-component system NarL family sensor kinase